MIKKYNELINYSQDEDYEEENELDEKFQIVGWFEYQQHWGVFGWIYILEHYNDNDAILCGGFIHRQLDIADHVYTELTQDELKNHIYNNETPICVYNKERNIFVDYIWVNLPHEIKNEL